MHFCDVLTIATLIAEPMASASHIPCFVVVLSGGTVLFDATLILFFIGALIWLITVKKLAHRLSQQVLGTQTYKTKQILNGLADKVKSQELTTRQAEKELEKMGDINVEYSETVIDGSLGLAITTLRNKLELIRKQESKQNWIAGGVAIISGIRRNETQIENYTQNVISSIVTYLEANLGAFFILEENELSVSATYAYDKQYSDAKTRINAEDGLLGQCIKEKELLYLVQIPANYVKIKSGLGEAAPKCLVIMPLIYRDQVYGAIEIASVKELAAHHLEFVQKSAEEIASELGALKTQTHTQTLLEQAQAQATQLASSEEELKQNMEEMQATQEEMRRNELALQEKLHEIETERAKNLAILESCMDAVVSFTINGTIEYCNRAGEEVLGYSRYELANHSILDILNLQIEYHGEEPALHSKTGNRITTRSEVNVTDRNGKELALLLTATHSKVKEKSLFTVFAQKISVDLF
jgi:PAS domain S-box-containing protein